MGACKGEIQRKQELAGDDHWFKVERWIALEVIDARWKEHLYTMDHLREGIWSISYAEKNPLVEYKLQGFRLFDEMVAGLKAQVVEFLMRVQIEDGPIEMEPRQRTQGTASHQELETFSGAGQDAAQQAIAGGPGMDQQGQGGAGSSTSGGGSSKRKKKSRRRRK
jgi:preprotein translocase subunit SecA